MTQHETGQRRVLSTGPVAWLGAGDPAPAVEFACVAAEAPLRSLCPDWPGDQTIRIAVAPFDLAATRNDVAAVRCRVDADCYLIALTPCAKAGGLEQWLDWGCDDVADPGDAQGIRLALGRARQAIAKRKALLDDRDNLQACIDNLPSPIFFKDRKGVYVGCNKAFEAYIGIPRERVIGSSVYDVAPPHLARVYEAADEELMRRGGSQIYDAQVRYADGAERDVSFQKAVLLDRNGEVRGLAGAMLDVTERVTLQKRLKIAAERDPLTGAYNRRKFFSVAEDLRGRALDEGKPLGLLALDIDHFKRLNDCWGHACGDTVLCEITALFDSLLPDEAQFARVGGEEFFGVFFGRGVEETQGFAELLRSRISQTEFRYDRSSLGVTASIGVAQALLPEETVWQALVRSDKALYRAKHGGRNRVEVAA